VEVEVDGEIFFTEVPKRLHSTITAKPPEAGNVYFASGGTPLLDANGNPSGFSLGVVLHSFEGQPLSWRNPDKNADANADGHVTSIDALQLINELNDRVFIDSLGRLPDLATFEEFPFIFYDVSGDGFLSAVDVVQVINDVNNALGAQAEGPTIFSANDPTLGALLAPPLFVGSNSRSANGPAASTIAGSSLVSASSPGNSDLVRPVRAEPSRTALAARRIAATDAALAGFGPLDSSLDDLFSERDDDLQENHDLDAVDLALEAVLEESSE
jgi:hypothetical protein